MGKKLQSVGRFYSRIIGKNIGIFLFTGIMSVTFAEHGWFPNEELYGIYKLVYTYLIPFIIAYEAGKTLKTQEGATVAALTTAGFIMADTSVGIMGAVIVAPLISLCILKIWPHIEARVHTGMELLVRNLGVGLFGVLGALLAYYILAPAIIYFTDGLGLICSFLVGHRLIGLLAIIIEPAKVFFLNNSINYGVFVPLGLSQVEMAGKSIMFLLESNPGPGLGVLLGLFFIYRKTDSKKSHSFLLSSIIEGIGGIHEVYFPYVLENAGLFLSVILGGMAGNFMFLIMGAEVVAPVTPGSIIPMLILSNQSSVAGIIAGVIVSMAVSLMVTVFVMKNCRKTNVVSPQKEVEKPMKKIKNIAVVCDGGMGSSAMGAAILRRKLKDAGIEGISVSAFATGFVPEETQLIICQRDFYPNLSDNEKAKQCTTVSSLVSGEEMVKIIKDYGLGD